MQKQKWIVTALILISPLCISSTSAYTFGMLAHDDTADSITAIEQVIDLTLPMVSFIRDDYDTHAIETLTSLIDTLGTGRIYHITLSPLHYSAAEVAGGYFDRQYSLFFKHIKNLDLRVVFRTMHEMNGGRYPRSGDPENFKKAWIHIYELAREAGLDQRQILFDFSVNGRDMPPATGVTPHQTALLIACTRWLKAQRNCLTREDYYPGDAYVDMIGVTFYNRGKATSNRARYSPAYILEEPRFDIRNRLVGVGKPVIIDEVGTTSIWYEGAYDRQTSLEHYEKGYGHFLKNLRLGSLATRASEKTELVALNYFNTDRTNGLSRENPGEADRSVIDLTHGKYYPNITKLSDASDDKLSTLFVTHDPTHREHSLVGGPIKKKKKQLLTTGG